MARKAIDWSSILQKLQQLQQFAPAALALLEGILSIFSQPKAAVALKAHLDTMKDCCPEHLECLKGILQQQLEAACGLAGVVHCEECCEE